MPYISASPALERALLAIGARGMRFDLDASAEIRRLRLARPGGDVTLVTPICFEDTVPRVCRRMVYKQGAKAADLLVSLCNDGWFGGDDAGRAHHVQVARFRCIENRVGMVRAANTGVSAAIDSAGRVISPADLFPGAGRAVAPRQAGWLLAELPLDSRSTVYGRVGDAWGWICLLGTAGLAAAAFVSHRVGSVP
jgi:apolipoprotein N-acyltransferase